MANQMAVRILEKESKILQEFPGNFIRQLNSLKLPQIKEMAKYLSNLKKFLIRIPIDKVNTRYFKKSRILP